MDKHNQVPETISGNLPMSENVNATYNIPNEVLQESVPQQPVVKQSVQINQPNCRCY